MAKPKHRRCQVCGCVTARYLRTQTQGPFVFKVWARDPVNGETSRVNGTRIYCTAHTPEES